MTKAERLELLKADLQNPPAAKDSYLTHLLAVAEIEIKKEGIVLDSTVTVEHLRIMYAAYLYRKRAAPETAMPRMLRWMLNQTLLSQKGKVDNVT